LRQSGSKISFTINLLYLNSRESEPGIFLTEPGIFWRSREITGNWFEAITRIGRPSRAGHARRVRARRYRAPQQSIGRCRQREPSGHPFCRLSCHGARLDQNHGDFAVRAQKLHARGLLGATRAALCPNLGQDDLGSDAGGAWLRPAPVISRRSPVGMVRPQLAAEVPDTRAYRSSAENPEPTLDLIGS
jgi:hypothetical protein